MIQQDIYRPQMAEKRDKLRQCTQNLRDQVDICDKRQTVEIAKAIERLDQLQGIAIQKADENLAASAELSRQAGEGFRQMDDCFSSVRQGLTNVEYGVSDLRVDMNQGMSRIETAILNQVNANAANWLAKSLSSNEVLFEWQAKAKAAEAEAKAAKEEARGMRDRSTGTLTHHVSPTGWLLGCAVLTMSGSPRVSAKDQGRRVAATYTPACLDTS